jgi:hypothetical protein
MTFSIAPALSFLLLILTEFTNSLTFTTCHRVDTVKIASVASVSRRNVFDCMSEAMTGGHTVATASVMTSVVPPASASGGATAGGAYLLSAKQRYNQRVRESLKAFVNL